MDLAGYLALITTEHAQRPNFVAVVSALLAPMIAAEAAALALPAAFDLDSAVGVQLDAVGEWIGRTRQIATPLPNVFFSFDTQGLGADQGVWFGPYAQTQGVTTLDDESYRFLLRGKIAANNWDGTLSGAAAALAFALGSRAAGSLLIVQDNQDMTLAVGIAGTPPVPIIQALLTGGYISVKPEGVRALYYVTSVPGSPLFGFDAENGYVSGFDVGGIATLVSAD